MGHIVLAFKISRRAGVVWVLGALPQQSLPGSLHVMAHVGLEASRT